MAILLEQRLSKKEIFELYANEVYLGQAGSFSIVGFGKAADAFFDKNVRDLTLEEAATIAGIITAPNRHTPLRYTDTGPGAAQSRAGPDGGIRDDLRKANATRPRPSR